MRGSVWVYIVCYLTNRQGNVFAKEKVYGFSDTRQIDTIGQQKLQYNKAINKALATYRSNNNLDSDTEVGFTHLNDGITYEGRKNGVKRIKRKKTKLSGSDKRQVRKEIFRIQQIKSESGKQVTQEEKQNMYDKKVSEKEFIKLNKSNKYPKNKNVYQNKNKLKHSNTKEDKRRIYLKRTQKLKEPKGNLNKPPK